MWCGTRARGAADDAEDMAAGFAHFIVDFVPTRERLATIRLIAVKGGVVFGRRHTRAGINGRYGFTVRRFRGVCHGYCERCEAQRDLQMSDAWQSS